MDDIDWFLLLIGLIERCIFTSQVIAYPMDMDGIIPEFSQQRWLWTGLKMNKNEHKDTVKICTLMLFSCVLKGLNDYIDESYQL